jgi:pyruvate/2-oxoglutarate dehydrogenase complex dihydrolipoamide acyltransferase (E2) component
MVTIVKMPKLGITMKEGTIGKWLLKEGDTVNEEDVLFEVSTDKLTNEVESDVSGVLRKILVQEGETVPCQTPLAIIAEADEDISAVL